MQKKGKLVRATETTKEVKMSNSGASFRANVMSERQASGTAEVLPARAESVRGWPRWAPYAAVVWSLVYAALGVSWAVSGRGFPYTPQPGSDVTGPLAGRFGESVAWIIV